MTALLLRWRRGDEDAAESLMSTLYPELRRRAGFYLRSERRDHTLQPTALVHEAYLRLVGSDVDWQHRVHFLVVAATTMRRILVDYAKSKGALKRGGERLRVTWIEDRQAAARRTTSSLWMTRFAALLSSTPAALLASLPGGGPRRRCLWGTCGCGV